MTAAAWWIAGTFAAAIAVVVGVHIRYGRLSGPETFERDFQEAVRTQGRAGRSPSKGVSH